MNITVFGAGSSGLAAIKKLRHENIFLTESKPRLDEITLDIVKKLGIAYETGGHTLRAVENAELIVVSPGVPLDIPVLKKARKLRIPIISEVELAYRYLKKPIIAVTGTNGKTTTTTLIARMFNDANLRAKAGGNIGFPLISVDDKNLDYVVAEVSSYQLEAIDKFRPKISVILNITEDHLARHKTMAEYAKQKAAVFRNQTKDDLLIYNYDDKLVRKIAEAAKAVKIPFSRKFVVKNGAYAKDGSVYFKDACICFTDDIRIKGDHNLENALAAVAAASLCGVKPASIRETLKSFKGVEHRIEFVRNVNDVAYYNDSKGTNPDSTIVAIKALAQENGLILILGGRDKMTDIEKMCNEIKYHVKEVVLLGEAKERFRKGLSKCGYSKLHSVKTFRDAVMESKKLARPGDAVLLSPACASFDMFKNYEERGKVFKQIVASL
jgi:UDP-N-acetylmuramoylalanine--D-glutamate ligase